MKRDLNLLAVLFLFFYLVCTLFSADTDQKRPLGVPEDARFFGGKWYKVYSGHISWHNARDKCVVLGGRLANVPDERTQAFIVGLADGKTLWLGATDEKMKGQWVWSDGSTMKFKAWNDNHPLEMRGFDYLWIIRDGRWNDAPDKDSGGVGFICEWEKK